MDWLFAVVLAAFLAVSLYGLVVQDMYLCLEALFLAFLPYLFWSAYRRVGTLDVFAPDLGFPIAYIVYLFVGSINLPIQTQFGLVLPWIVWFYYILGLVAYLVGVRVIRKPTPIMAAVGVRKRFWPEDRFITVVLIVLLVGVGARAVEVMRSGLEIFHADDAGARVVGARGSLGVLTLFLVAGFEFAFIYLLVKKPRGPARWVIAGFLILVMLNGVATTNRTSLLSILLAGVVIFHYVFRRLNFTAVIVAGLLGAAFASALGTFRDVSQWGDAHIEKLENQGFTNETYWLVNGYDAVRLPPETFYMTIQQIPAVDHYTYGSTSLASFTEALPGHRPGPSEIVKDTLRLRFVGFGAAATILAPLWFDGGSVGIVIGMFLFGLLSRILHEQVLRSSSYVWILIYGWYVQNALKAIKDDIFPDLGVLFVMVIFFVVSVVISQPEDPMEFAA